MYMVISAIFQRYWIQKGLQLEKWQNDLDGHSRSWTMALSTDHQILGFSTDFRHCPYNTLATMQVCDITFC